MNFYIHLIFSTLGFLAVAIIVIVSLLILYLTVITGRCNSNVSLVGKTAVVTGGDSGIGYETALDFAKRGARVILASFANQKLGEEAMERIINETNNPNVFFKHVNLASFESIREFAKEIINSEKRLDILVNNAGAMGLPFKITEDGFLLLMQTNYFGPFLLTVLLLDLIRNTPNARIINVASVLAKYVNNLDINNLNTVPPQNSVMMHTALYARSKLCLIFFTIELAKRLRTSSVTTYSVHPGATYTSILKHHSILRFCHFVSRIFVKNPRAGAETSIHCSLTKGIENLSGHHFHNCHVVKRYKTAQDPDLPEKLWNITEKLLKL